MLIIPCEERKAEDKKNNERHQCIVSHRKDDFASKMEIKQKKSEEEKEETKEEEVVVTRVRFGYFFQLNFIPNNLDYIVIENNRNIVFVVPLSLFKLSMTTAIFC